MAVIMSSVWTSDYEKIVVEWRAKSFVNMWLQLKSAYYYETINDILTYPMIVFSSVSGATIFATDTLYTRLIIAILSLITVVITGILIEVRPGQKAEAHFACMRCYTALIRNMDYCTSLPFNLRPEPIHYIDKVNNEIIRMSDQDILIPKFIITKFEKKFGNLDRILYNNEIVDLLEEDIKQKYNLKSMLIKTIRRTLSLTKDG